MQEIKCPKCGQVFTVDESGYTAIAQQIRDQEFNKELDDRLKQLEASKEDAIKLAASDAEKKIAELEAKLALAKSEAAKNLAEELAKKELEIAELTAAAKAETAHLLAEKDKEFLTLKAEMQEQLQEQKSKKDKKIAELTAKVDQSAAEKELAVTKAVAEKEQELAIRKEELTAQKESYESQLKNKEELIDYYKDLKTRQSTKMLGETLEQHCEIEFNKLRATAFQNAYFEKDNDARTGSKGDYIYKESTADGVEFISIMFEMKNEADTTATKHKNEDFFKELDKDRNEKGCEYAVLVSMLEADSELYNQGIVDVSYRYPKMYVIRPQLFIPMITLLRNAALNAVQYQTELAVIKNQNLDITHFEDDLNDFKDKFSRNVKLAEDRFEKAIDEIDTTIKHLEKIKENLLASGKNLQLADKKLDDLTIKKLTRKNPTMKEKFAELN